MKTVVGVFDTHEHAQQVVRDLVDMGLDRNDISLLAHHRGAAGSGSTSTGAPLGTGEPTGLGDQRTADGTTVGENVAGGALFGGIGGLLIGLGALAIPGIGPVVAAGPLATTLAGAGFGALGGGLIGAIKDLGVPDEDANFYAESVRRGSTVVTVRADDAMVDRVEDVMNRNGAIDVDERHTQYRQGGFTGFSHDADPYNNYDEDVRRRGDLVGSGVSSGSSTGTGSGTLGLGGPTGSGSAGLGTGSTGSTGTGTTGTGSTGLGMTGSGTGTGMGNVGTGTGSLTDPSGTGTGSMGSAGGSTFGGRGDTTSNIAGSGDIDRTTRGRARIYPRV